ncbi:alpha/beta hydrolase [Cypionkella sp.]|uniref:alpha/beta hydrolase n=1 Tax=Cypionkella sp. TaxID=2811411 RepID=UPI003752976A
MRSFGKALGRLLAVFFLLYATAFYLIPQDQVDHQITFDPNSLGSDLDAYLAKSEQQFSDITAGTQKRIIWAGAVGVKTPLALIYLHGFSATSEEIRPVPADLARALGANIFFTRLTGHGRDGAALAAATASDWVQDMAEAMAIGRRIGGRVVVIGTSTGGTLAALAASDPVLSQGMAGLVLISPNFGLKPLAGKILDLPAARYWGPLVAGATRSFTPQNDRHREFWTVSYPTVALFPMAALVREARAQDYSQTKLPLLLLYSPQDQVVDPAQTLEILGHWAGPKQIEPRIMTVQDDPFSHVIAGDILSPNQTAATEALILAWAQAL